MSFVTRLDSDNDSSNVRVSSFSRLRGHIASQKCDPVLIQECAKIILELNHEAAVYCTLVVRIGGSQDSEDLRVELKRIRIRSLELAHLNKVKLIPLLRNKSICHSDVKELERLYSIYSACLELMEVQLIKTLSLLKNFPLHCDSRLLIHTGLADPYVLCKHSSVTLENLDNDSESRRVLEREEVNTLERDVKELHDLLYSVNQTVAVAPWAINEGFEHSLTLQSQNSKSSNDSGSSSDSYALETNVSDSVDDSKKRRCVCLILFTFTAVSISAIIIGIVLGVINQ